ncbi:MAG TPA: hypothetical protein VI172_13165 [Candidatus Dormibacteraeota bacterium]|jgi:uncharacterized protein YceH (UPF0502 family)
MSKRDPDVDRWLKGKRAELMLRRVRDVIMWADERMTEYLKYGTVQFACKGDFANFVRHDQRTVELMFNRGAKIPGTYRYLEGSGPTARHMRFADMAEVEAKTQELSNLARAWCDLMSPRVRKYTRKARPGA